MRLWSIKFEYLDSKGIVALWRESLLAKAVLEGKTKGYTKHPQLYRFMLAEDPISAINAYLHHIHSESVRRGYSFDISRVQNASAPRMPISQGQLDYELGLLKAKLKKRDQNAYEKLQRVIKAEPNAMFVPHKGGIEEWEKVKDII